MFYMSLNIYTVAFAEVLFFLPVVSSRKRKYNLYKEDMP